MYLFLPVTSFIFIFLSLYKWRERTCLCARSAFLLASLICGVIVVVITELLSLFQMLSLPYVAAAWGLVTLISMYPVLILQPRKGFLPPKNIFKGLALLDWAMVSIIAFIALLVGLTAYKAAPNTWDSLTYHMARVAHWIENRTVRHYPTNIDRQLFFQPGAEFGILQLQILARSDRFANFVQWFSMVGSIIGTSLIAKYLGANKRAQIFSALLTATLPMGILQASGTQNDYTVSFWLICFAAFLLMFFENQSPLFLAAASAGMGLALLTKGTAYFIALPFCVWVLIFLVKKHKQRAFKYALIPILLALSLNIGHYTRNYKLSGNLLGGGASMKETVNAGMSPALFLSNVTRNAGMHLGTSLKPVNSFFEKGVYLLHKLLNVDITDPRITFGRYPFHISVNTHEDTAGHFCQLLLILASTIIFILSPCFRKTKFITGYFFSLLAGLALFNLLLKWQPYSSRLHLPFFVLFSPFVGAAMFRSPNEKTIAVITTSVAVILTATSMPYVFRNNSRRLISSKSTVFSVPREQQYFTNVPELYESYKGAVDFVKGRPFGTPPARGMEPRAGTASTTGKPVASDAVKERQCRDIGLSIGGNSWEYPFWVLFDKNTVHGYRLEHVRVTQTLNIGYPLGEFDPCAVIALNLHNSDKAEIEGKEYFKVWREGPVSVYTKEPLSP